MPKKFSDKQRVLIKEKMINIGIEMFGQFGFSKISIDEIIRETGISKGSFYNFYESKEEYFMDVLERLESDNRSQMDVILKDKSLSPSLRFSAYMTANIESMEKNLILVNMKYQDIENLMMRLPSERISRHMEGDMQFTMNIIKELREEAGLGHDVDWEALSAMFHFIFYIFIHKREIGESQYKAGMKKYIEMICDYLFSKEQPENI